MTMWINHEQRACQFCGRRVSRPNYRRHADACWPRYVAVMLALLRLVPAEYTEAAP